MLQEEGIERIPGAHCYEFFASPGVFAALSEAEPGTFYLTDFLLRHFERLVIRPLGLDVFHDRAREGRLAADAPILAQREHCRFYSELCKPLVTRVPTRWVAGFHAADQAAQVDPELFLIHLKYADYDDAMRRLEITSTMKWSKRAIESGWGKRHRADKNEITRNFFDAPAARLAHEGGSELDPRALAESVNRGLTQAHGVWRCPPIAGNKLYLIPKWLKSAL